MLKLYVSTTKKVKIKEIFKCLKKSNLDFQLYKNYSYCKGVPELGYKIVFFDLDKKDFKSKIWNGLSELLDLHCAFVKYKDYRGCISNWPGIFVESRCPNHSLKPNSIK